MDPNLFHLDWERTFEALVGIIVLSFFVERALAIFFESRWWIHTFEDKRVGRYRRRYAAPGTATDSAPDSTPDTGGSGPPAGEDPSPPEEPVTLPAQRFPLKELLSFVLAFVICRVWDFDAVSIILLSETTLNVGHAVTAAVIAGGSKASIKLFHDVMNVRSSAMQEKQKLKDADGKVRGA